MVKTHLAILAFFALCDTVKLDDLHTNIIYHNEFAVHIPSGKEAANEIARKYGYDNIGQIGSLENYFLFKHHRISKRSVDPASDHHSSLIEEPMIEWVEQQVEKKRFKRDFVQDNNDSKKKRQFFQNPFSRFGRINFSSQLANVNPRALGRFPDPLYRRQWYLAEGANGGFDMNVAPAWTKGYTGKGVVVSILDDGIQHSHPDLRFNYDPQASTDINNNDHDPMPRDNGDNKHGTRCAGEVAAIAFNDICGVGVAYNASIGGVRMLDGTVNDAVEARAISLNPDHVDIYSASWGPEDDGKTVDGPGPLAKRAFINGAIRGRHGRGSIFVWASGNGGRHIDNCNCDGYTNSIFTLSISSASQRGSKPWYLEECSSTLATTYSSGTPGVDQSVITADMDGSLRPDHICTTDHTGTSASAPLAAGICALALEANPDLTWRDMQHIVVRTSRHEPLNREEGWFVNGVGNYASHKFGYGLMDAGSMVDLATKWTTVPPQHVCQTNIHRSEQTIPTIRGTFVSSEIITDGCAGTHGEVRYLEHVQAQVSLRFLPRGNINIQLISPSGTRSTLLFERPRDVLSEKFDDWPFLSVHFWGEKAVGRWQLIVTNAGVRIVKEPGVLIHWKLILHGTKDPPERLRFPHSSQQSFNPSFNQFGEIIFSESIKDEVREPLDSHMNLLNKGTTQKESWNDITNVTIGTVCHSECQGGCFGRGPNSCRGCKHFSLQEECVHTCPEGTYDSEENECLPCHGSCAQCIGPRQNQCSSCHQSLFVAHLGICVDNCPVGYFAENRLCVKCGRQCAFCTSKKNCSKCDHHLLLYNGSCHTVCPERHFETDSLRCEPCHSLCASCIGNTLYDCASCDSGNFFFKKRCIRNCPKGTYGDPVNQICAACPMGCTSCNRDNCTACNKGWKLKRNICVVYKTDKCKIAEYLDRRGSCQPCHQNCLSCITENQCSHCQPSLVMHKGQCILDCPSGYFRHRGRCLQCSPGCNSCTSYLRCTECNSKFHLHKNHCISSCPNGFYSDLFTCLKCDATCSTCWGPNKNECLTCSKDMVQLESSCIEACPLGSYQKSESCLPCFHNCRSCNDTGIHSCTSCSDYFTLESGMCLECRTGRYYNSTTHSCQSCHETCLTCSEKSNKSCTSCQAPLSLHPSTSSCRSCCPLGVKENMEADCCKCDHSTGKCFGSATTDKKRIASNPPYSARYEAQPSIIFGSTTALIVIICLVNILIFSVVFGTLQLRSKRRGSVYAYQPLPLSTSYHDQYLLTKLTSFDEDSDETEYSPLHTKT